MCSYNCPWRIDHVTRHWSETLAEGAEVRMVFLAVDLANSSESTADERRAFQCTVEQVVLDSNRAIQMTLRLRQTLESTSANCRGTLASKSHMRGASNSDATLMTSGIASVGNAP